MSNYVRESDITLKAIVQHKYGSPDDLELMAIDSPVVKDDEVLVRVRAAPSILVSGAFDVGRSNFERSCNST